MGGLPSRLDPAFLIGGRDHWGPTIICLGRCGDEAVGINMGCGQDQAGVKVGRIVPDNRISRARKLKQLKRMNSTYWLRGVVVECVFHYVLNMLYTQTRATEPMSPVPMHPLQGEPISETLIRLIPTLSEREI